MSRQRGYKRYSPEFKREALKRASEDGMTDKQVCEELGISARQLGRWRDEFRLLGADAVPHYPDFTSLIRPWTKVLRVQVLDTAAAWVRTAGGSGSTSMRRVP